MILVNMSQSKTCKLSKSTGLNQRVQFFDILTKRYEPSIKYFGYIY